MSSYIDVLAKKLIEEKQNVILYGADADAIILIEKLKKYYHTQPTCLCDNDKSKWHKFLLGIEILPPDDAVAKFPNAFFFIAKGFYKYQIIGNLLSNEKIQADRIINCEPIEKRISCPYLESYLFCSRHKLLYCCSDFGKNKSPSIVFNGDYESSIQEYTNYRDKLIKDLNDGIPTPCDGCSYIKEDWYASERKIMIFNYGEGGICNFDCCYCQSPAKSSKDISKDINVKELLNILSKNYLLSEDLHTIISCGEICVHPKRIEICDSISKFRNSICTNASILDNSMLKLLELGNTELVVSIDAGTRSTFAKVKGYDLFDKVCENLKRYGSVGEVRLKYILLPGINDNRTDIDGFISICKQIGTKLVQISYNLYAPKKLTQQTIDMAKYFVTQLSKNKLVYRIISDVINNAVNEY